MKSRILNMSLFILFTSLLGTIGYAGENLFLIQFNIDDHKLEQDLCRQMKSQATAEYIIADIECRYDEVSKEDIDNSKYFIQVEERNEDILFELSLKNDPILNEEETLKWNFNKNAELEAYKKIFSKVIEYDRHGKQYRKDIFKTALAINPRIQKDAYSNMYRIYDKDGGFDNYRKVNEELAVNEFLRESDRNRNFLKASIELGVILGLAKMGYDRDHSMVQDWDYENKTIGDFSRRLFTTEQVKFDDNAIGTNWGHAHAGTFYYLVGRNNGYNFYESFLITLASSSIWEYFLENKEVVSLNDQIMTTVGGSIIGETLYQVSGYLKRRKGMTPKIMAALINPVGAINDWIPPRTVQKGRDRFKSAYGFSEDNFSSFDIITGIKMVEDSRGRNITMAQVGIDSEVSGLNIGGAGKIKKFVVDNILTELVVKADYDKQFTVQNFYTLTKIVMGGLFSQDIKESDAGGKFGKTVIISPALRTEYMSNGVENENGFYAVVSLFGATLDVTYYYNQMKFRFAVDVYGDFAMVRPTSIDDYKAKGHDFKDAQSVLAKNDYYYGLGGSGTLKASVQYKNFEFGASASHGQYSSINKQSLNRYEDRVTNPLDAKDTFASLKVWVLYNINERVAIESRLEALQRKGKLKSINSGELLSEGNFTDYNFYTGVRVKY